MIFATKPVSSTSLKQAIDFCKWGGSPITFKSLFDSSDLVRDERGQHIYRAVDIRKARLALMDLESVPERPEVLPPVIYCRIPKGGVGKTTVTGNVGACLAMQGYKVLMIDADPQASLTSLFGIDWAVEQITHIGNLLVLQPQFMAARIPCADSGTGEPDIGAGAATPTSAAHVQSRAGPAAPAA